MPGYCGKPGIDSTKSKHFRYVLRFPRRGKYQYCKSTKYFSKLKIKKKAGFLSHLLMLSEKIHKKSRITVARSGFLPTTLQIYRTFDLAALSN